MKKAKSAKLVRKAKTNPLEKSVVKVANKLVNS
jgi:hypothetical protein